MSLLRKVGLILGILALLSGCSAPKTSPPQTGEIVEGKELCCLCESEEKAEEIAELYGIELVDWNHGTAVFHTEDDPKEVIQYGIDNDLPLLELNRKRKLLN